MRRAWRWTIGGMLFVAAAVTGCNGSSGGNGATGAAGPTPGPNSGSGGDGGSGEGGGGAATSLNTTRFRTIEVATTPRGGGTVSDNFADFGSAVQSCESCRERYQLGVTLALTATPAPAYRFMVWEGGPCEGQVEPTCRFTVTQGAQVTAVFRR